MIVLDTNVYIDVIESRRHADSLASRIEDAEDEVAVSSVVVSELLIGLKDPKREAHLRRLLITSPDALVTPNHEDWLVAGGALRALGGHAAIRRRSFWNDILIAASCARAGATLVTSNAADFRRIQRTIPLKTVPAWGASAG